VADSPQLKEIYVRSDDREVTVRIDFEDDTHSETRFHKQSSRTGVIASLMRLLDQLMKEETGGNHLDPT